MSRLESLASPCHMGEATKPVGVHCVKGSKLKEVSREVLVWRLQHVSSGVSGFAVSIEEAATPFIVQCVKVSKLEEVSHEMLVVMLQSTV